MAKHQRGWSYVLDGVQVMILLVSLPSCCFSSPTDYNTLRQVSVVYRHGDRSPIHIYKSSAHNVSNFWHDGLGQLTTKGAEGEYELGDYFRNRYGGFLSAQYNMSEIYVRSTNIDRALMSASSVLSALYPHQGAKPPMQPVPIHTVPKLTDFMLGREGTCEQHDKIAEARKNSTVMQNIFKTYKDILKDLEPKVGEEVNNKSIGYIIDSLYIEHLYNVAPEWLTPELLTTLIKIQGLLFYNAFCGSDICPLSAGGRIVRKFIDDMEAQLTPGAYTVRPIKFYMYSAHDSTVASVMCTMNLFNNITVPYGAAIMVELHEMNTTSLQNVVRVFYKNQTYGSDQEVQLQLPGCELDCPLEMFKKLVKNFTAETPSGKCEVNTDLKFDFFTHYDSTTILLIVLITEVGCLLLVLFCSLCTIRRCCRQKSKHRTYGRLRVETHPEEVPMISGGGSDGEE